MPIIIQHIFQNYFSTQIVNIYLVLFRIIMCVITVVITTTKIVVNQKLCVDLNYVMKNAANSKVFINGISCTKSHIRKDAKKTQEYE